MNLPSGKPATPVGPRIFTLDALAKAVGVTRYALRHDLRTGLIPAAESTPRGRRYVERHLHHALAITALRRQKLRGETLVRAMQSASPSQIRAWAGVPEPAPPPKPEVPPARREVVDSLLWTMVESSPLTARDARALLAAVCARMAQLAATPESIVKSLVP